jgi:hypothetical protein
LYLDPPEKALVLCVDEKSQIQALDRSAPVLPMIPGMPERRTHDYVRHGITTCSRLGRGLRRGLWVNPSPPSRGRVHEVLDQVGDTVPADLDVHLICDNYSTHKSPMITKWHAAHPRFHMHFFVPVAAMTRNAGNGVRRGGMEQPARHGRNRPIARRSRTPRPPHTWVFLPNSATRDRWSLALDGQRSRVAQSHGGAAMRRAPSIDHRISWRFPAKNQVNMLIASFVA